MGIALYGNFQRRMWLPVLEAAGLPPVGVHVLGHTCASLLADEGASLHEVGAQLGHRSPQRTAGYRHMFAETERRQAEALERARERAKPDGARHTRAIKPGRGLRAAP